VKAILFRRRFFNRRPARFPQPGKHDHAILRRVRARHQCRHDKNFFVSDHVSGHEFTRAATRPYDLGFSP